MRDEAARLAGITGIDRALWREGKVFAGIDEAGRGPLCGPVVAACVIMPPSPLIDGVNDSKKCSQARREALYGRIMECASFVGVGEASVQEIDALNILQATRLAMRRAAQGAICDLFLVDGNQTIELPEEQKEIEVRALTGGDARCYSIAAASIVAKTTRDRAMCTLDGQYPGYGLARHKGYGTAAHIAAIRALGPSPIHRRSFLRKILGDDA